MADYVREVFGFRHEWLGVVAATLAAFSVGFCICQVLALRCVIFNGTRLKITNPIFLFHAGKVELDAAK